MANNKLCCRLFPVVLFVISLILAAAIWYFEEGVRQFNFLKSFGEFINYFGTALFISVLPIAIFYVLNDKEKWQSKAKIFALAGFVPTIVFLILLLV